MEMSGTIQSLILLSITGQLIMDNGAISIGNNRTNEYKCKHRHALFEYVKIHSPGTMGQSFAFLFLGLLQLHLILMAISLILSLIITINGRCKCRKYEKQFAEPNKCRRQILLEYFDNRSKWKYRRQCWDYSDELTHSINGLKIETREHGLFEFLGVIEQNVKEVGGKGDLDVFKVSQEKELEVFNKSNTNFIYGLNLRKEIENIKKCTLYGLLWNEFEKVNQLLNASGNTNSNRQTSSNDNSNNKVQFNHSNENTNVQSCNNVQSVNKDNMSANNISYNHENESIDTNVMGYNNENVSGYNYENEMNTNKNSFNMEYNDEDEIEIMNNNSNAMGYNKENEQMDFVCANRNSISNISNGNMSENMSVMNTSNNSNAMEYNSYNNEIEQMDTNVKEIDFGCENRNSITDISNENMSVMSNSNNEPMNVNNNNMNGKQIDSVMEISNGSMNGNINGIYELIEALQIII